jgi:alpha-beta hydrolase superfamily lysophospholipase
MRRRSIALLVAIVVLVVGGYAAVPYARAVSLIVRAANMGGPTAQKLAALQTYSVSIADPHVVPTRHGDVAAQFYSPDAFRRTVLLIPGLHSAGIEEPRLRALARELAATGVNVMTMALPDLQHYRISPDATDVIEDAVLWLAKQPRYAPDGRVGVLGVSFAGGLSVAAASRPSMRDTLAYVVSFGGHGDLQRVMRYLATGEEADVEGLVIHPPHDYGVAVILYGLADRGVVPLAQVPELRKGIETFLLGSQQSMVDKTQADRTYAAAREYEKTLPEPSRTYMKYVNDRAVKKLGAVLELHLNQLGADDPALSPDLATSVPAVPIYLMHGDDDNVIPAAESAMLYRYLRSKGADVHLLLTGVVTHAEVNKAAAATEGLKLIAFWAGILKR